MKLEYVSRTKKETKIKKESMKKKRSRTRNEKGVVKKKP